MFDDPEDSDDNVPNLFSIKRHKQEEFEYYEKLKLLKNVSFIDMPYPMILRLVLIVIVDSPSSKRMYIHCLKSF